MWRCVAGRLAFNAVDSLEASKTSWQEDEGELKTWEKFRVTAVAWNPVYRYDPRLFSEVADHKPGALLPAGANSPVGAVWIATSKAHIGIHGTPNPETIGFASSHGCVRLTNWDATRLGRAASSGIPVEFTA